MYFVNTLLYGWALNLAAGQLRMRQQDYLPIWTRNHFIPPIPRTTPAQFALRLGIVNWAHLPPKYPKISDAQFKVLAKLYYKHASARIRELGTQGSTIDKLKALGYVLEKYAS